SSSAPTALTYQTLSRPRVLLFDALGDDARRRVDELDIAGRKRRSDRAAGGDHGRRAVGRNREAVREGSGRGVPPRRGGALTGWNDRKSTRLDVSYQINV